MLDSCMFNFGKCSFSIPSFKKATKWFQTVVGVTCKIFFLLYSLVKWSVKLGISTKTTTRLKIILIIIAITNK